MATVGVKALRVIQIGQEVTPGTECDATTVWRGTGTIEDKGVPQLADEDVGYLLGTDRTYISRYEAALTLEQEATFEQFPIVLDSCIDTVAGVKDGAGTGYVYTYALPTTAAAAIKTRTIEGGDNIQAEIMLYSFCTGFKLSGKGGEAWKLSSDWRGRDVNTTTYTAAVARPTVNVMNFNQSTLAIDAIGGTAGATVKSDTLLAAELTVKDFRHAVEAGNGNLYFAFDKVSPDKSAIELKITFEYDATSVAEKAACKAQTPRILRVKTVGTAFGTPGTAYTYRTMFFDLYGVWLKFDKIGEENGNDIVTGTFSAHYNTTAASAGQFVVVPELSALP
jgi:hypothetical protein